MRNYEADLSDLRVPLDDVMGPIGVDVLVGDVIGLNCGRHEITCRFEGRATALSYDWLVFALGSELVRPMIPGLAEHGFDIDTYDAAVLLNQHFAALPTLPATPGRYTALVVGGGLTGVEMATELTTTLREIAGKIPVRVIIADRSPRIGSNMGNEACAVIDKALTALDVETRPGVTVRSIDARVSVCHRARKSLPRRSYGAPGCGHTRSPHRCQASTTGSAVPRSTVS